jgi:LmbE family N-acetylglucosaminyl deacetylase
MRILAIGSHPDDIEFGCAGTLIKAGQNGHETSILVMTRGGHGEREDVRVAEQEEAARLMGIKTVFWGDYEDTRIPMSTETIQFIESVIKEVGPDLIFVHSPHDTHQDHLHLAQATNSATRYIKNVLYYEGPTTQDFGPTVFEDIGGIIEEKLNALKAHSSQVMKTRIEDQSILDVARSTANYRGIQSRVKYAEAFLSSRLFLSIKDRK